MASPPVQNPTSNWNIAIADLVNYEDLPSLWGHLFKALASYTNITNLSFIRYQKNSVPLALFSNSVDDPIESRVEAYVNGAYLLDPFYRACMYERYQGINTLTEVAPPDFKESQYYQTFFSAYGLYDEINIFNWFDENTVIALSLGRTKGERRFGQNSMVRLQEVEPLLSAISLKTWEKYSQFPLIEDHNQVSDFHQQLVTALKNFGTSILTPREKDVLDYLLRGYAVKSAAEQLGITPGTLRIHRHSIYEKLDIGSQTELFALILECLKQTTDNTDVDPFLRMMPPEY